MIQTILNSWNDRLLRLAFLCILLMGAAVASIVPFQSIIGIERLGLSDAAYAAISILGSGFSVAASILVGIFSDQTGRYREVLIGSIIAGLLAACCMFFVPTQASFILVHMVLFPISATAFTQYFALASLAARRNNRLDKEFSLSMIRAAFAGSFALTPPIWAIIVAGGVDLLVVYGFIAAVNVLVLVIVIRGWPRENTSQTEEKSGISLFAALGELAAFPLLIRLVLIAVIVGMNGLYNILLGLLVVNNLGGTESDVGWFAGGVALTEVPVMLMSALLIRRLTRRGAIFLGAMVYVAFLIALAMIPSMAIAWWLIIPAGIGAGILLSITVGYIQDLVAHRAGAGSALVSVSHFGGMIFASVILAAGSVVTDYVGIALIGAAIGFVAGLSLFVIDRPKADIQADTAI
ncbi:MFS transporter [Yoonia sp. BS5-3]|uniref:MFS transporter n=1 Tax=Yoonia phaeophyticola TaxID=3137369 RepID=A0ABZ2V941_9RHOB